MRHNRHQLCTSCTQINYQLLTVIICPRRSTNSKHVNYIDCIIIKALDLLGCIHTHTYLYGTCLAGRTYISVKSVVGYDL